MKPLRDILPLAHEDGHDEEPVLVEGTQRPDDITTGGGPQHIHAGNGGDTVRAGSGPDIIEAGNGDDTVYAEGGPDSVWGGNGNDLLEGGGGPDDINGGRGNDTIIGGAAVDLLTGGTGRDVFVYQSASEAAGHGGHDGEEESDQGSRETITDFQVGSDLFDFRAIGTVTSFADGPKEGSAWAVQQGPDTVLYVDTNGSLEGDQPAEMQILLLGVQASDLTADDFLF